MPEIKPRIDDDGVPWCDVGCPQGTNEPRGVTFCFIDGRARYVMDAGGMNATNCPHAVKRMAVENEAWRRLRPEVAAFALMMEDRLRAHDHKSGWHRCAVGHLFGRLLDEAAELHHAIDGDFGVGDSDEEAADVANFAMMICDNLGGLDVDALMAEREE